jgi:L-threonylcarbamoyladenylate synthase
MSATELTAADAERLRVCVSGGGVAVFPTDTVYGVCCDPDDAAAVSRLYDLKGYPPARSPERPAAVMFFALPAALEALAELHSAERAALEALLPGPVTLLLPNRAKRFAPACGPDPDTVGVRVPRLPDALAALGSVSVPVMQSSANLRGQADARTLEEVPKVIRKRANFVLDGGELPGTHSTVIDLRDYAYSGRWQVLREGALSRDAVAKMLAPTGLNKVVQRQ